MPLHNTKGDTQGAVHVSCEASAVDQLYNIGKLSLDKSFAKPSYLCIAEGKKFTNAVKVAISSMQSLT